MSQHTTTSAAPRANVKALMGDIITTISWRDIANRYFGKSASWLYHKMDGIDGNGGKGGFTEQETIEFKNALIDLSDRLRAAADRI